MPTPKAGYPGIPDHSDLRGFSYHAPEGYRWSDDHPGYSGKGPKGYERPDSRIREDICEALALHPGIDAGGIAVEVKKGVVTLEGEVPDRWTKRAAEFVIDRIPGVQDVRNRLVAMPSGRDPEEERRWREIQARETTGSGLFPG